jgi:hypothetical protein
MTILAEIESKIIPGTIIPKPQARADFVVKGWGLRRRERALIYTIPNHKTPTKPHEKGVTVSEWVQAFEQLTNAGNFSSAWFKKSMPVCAKEGGCNFTTIGGIFELLRYAAYDRGTYRKSPNPTLIASKQTARYPYAEALANDPRFTEAPKTGGGFIVGGVKPPR